ncbi:type II toxin-antitoxin system Phd/YefM family antitoxin [Xanthomonas massiliensis]|uniref:type II toxin-antitoxin system Phd/YefM family antitoxin n=1 Tax=Xanthomonas massiliensis TaxID=1720302 RepID=UPI0008258666|nr:type II toxin-antitoxin system Phd/YefM family antitoxin [Xanthomonas massiliensis]
MSTTVNMFEAKSNLSKLVAQIEDGVIDEVIIARSGKPAVRMVPIRRDAQGVAHRIGVARGAFVVPADIDADNPQIASLFTGIQE